MSQPDSLRVIDRPVACPHCHMTVRTSRLADHLEWRCRKARAVRHGAPNGWNASQQRNEKGAVRRPGATGAPRQGQQASPSLAKAAPTGMAPGRVRTSRDGSRADWYTRAEFKLIGDAYQHIFGAIGPELRAYWDLDRKRPWGCLTTDFARATYDRHEEASRRASEIEQTEFDLIRRGQALREVTRQTGVGLSLGVCPWTDHALFQTYAQNQHKRRLTIILGHDWYPIVPETTGNLHPVDVPLRRDGGLHALNDYINAGAVPAAILDKSELLLFLNYKPDFRPPNTPVTGTFDPYDRCAEGFRALVQAVAREFTVQVISWSAPVWEALSLHFMGNRDPQGICARLRHPENFGRVLELHVGRMAIPYLPLAHPCDERNFNKLHAAHAHEGFLRMGLGGRGRSTRSTS